MCSSNGNWTAPDVLPWDIMLAAVPQVHTWPPFVKTNEELELHATDRTSFETASAIATSTGVQIVWAAPPSQICSNMFQPQPYSLPESVRTSACRVPHATWATNSSFGSSIRVGSRTGRKWGPSPCSPNSFSPHTKIAPCSFRTMAKFVPLKIPAIQYSLCTHSHMDGNYCSDDMPMEIRGLRRHHISSWLVHWGL